MVEDGKHAAVACRHIAQWGGEQIQPAAHGRSDLGQGQAAVPSGRQFDGQRHSLQQTADLADLLQIGGRGVIAWIEPLHLLQEETNTCLLYTSRCV